MIHRFVSKQEQIECDIVAIIYRWSMGQLFVQMTMLYLHASLVGEEGMGHDNALHSGRRKYRIYQPKAVMVRQAGILQKCSLAPE